jgi:hypothetical protein
MRSRFRVAGVREARTVRGEASIGFLAAALRVAGPTDRLCPLGAPKEAMAQEGPGRRMVSVYEYDGSTNTL